MGANDHTTCVPSNYDQNNTVAADGGEDEETVVQDLYDSVSLQRGLGYSGKKVAIVERECGMCHYDRMGRVIHVYPESPRTVKFFCQNPNCPDAHEHDVSNLGYIPR